MTTAGDIRYLLAGGKGPQVDWLPAGTEPGRIAASLAGMANAMGGSLIVGVSPRTNRVHGVDDPEQAIDLVLQAALLLEPPLILPFPERVDLDTGAVVVVRVPPGLPHVYALEGRYLVRDGAVIGPLSAPRLRRLLLERGEASFESESPEGASLSDLDPDRIQAYLSAVALPAADPWPALLSRGCVIAHHGGLMPTAAGLLLFGRDPQRCFPQADLTAARFAGRTVTDEFVRQVIRGTLTDQLQAVEVFLRSQLRETVRLEGMQAARKLEYPLEAVRELVVNAVAHRDYSIRGHGIRLFLFSDRLELQSPGGLPGPVTVDNIAEARFSRNPVIVQVLADLGYIERLGYGIDRVIALAAEWKLRRPLFEETAAGFRVTLFASTRPVPEFHRPRWEGTGLNQRQQQALDYLHRRGRITNREFQELAPDVHPETIRRDLADLVARGIVLKVGDRRGTYYILKQAAHVEP
ncbi:MAG: ATP-binding protein [Chloroflexota bacterium]